MVFVVKDIIVIYRKIKTIFILISFKRYFSHPEKSIFNLTQVRDYGSDFPPKFYVSNLVFVFLSLQFNFVKYVIVACELSNDNSLDQRMLLKN